MNGDETAPIAPREIKEALEKLSAGKSPDESKKWRMARQGIWATVAASLGYIAAGWLRSQGVPVTEEAITNVIVTIGGIVASYLLTQAHNDYRDRQTAGEGLKEFLKRMPKDGWG